MNPKLLLSALLLFFLFSACQKDNLATSSKKAVKYMQGDWTISSFSFLDRTDFSVRSTTTVAVPFRFEINERHSNFPLSGHAVEGFMLENDSCSTAEGLFFDIGEDGNSNIRVYNSSSNYCSYFMEHFPYHSDAILYIPHEDSIWYCHEVDSLPTTYKAYLWVRQTL